MTVKMAQVGDETEGSLAWAWLWGEDVGKHSSELRSERQRGFNQETEAGQGGTTSVLPGKRVKFQGAVAHCGRVSWRRGGPWG